MRRLFVLAALAATCITASARADYVDPSALREDLRTPRAFALPAQRQAEIVTPPATPRAKCNDASRPEPSIQGRLPKEVVDSGAADEGYWCNLTQIGHAGSTGGFRVHRYIDQAGRECAYYDTALLFPTNALSLAGELTGVAVLDMSDPTKPKRVTTLLSPAMQSPHESLNISVQRGILAAVLGNPGAYPGGIDVYDISEDCRNPQLKSAAFLASPFGHESGMAPDGQTFYPTSIGTGNTVAVDISNPSLPRTLVDGRFNTHGMTVSEDGNRGYLATGDGLVIADLSDVQSRKPNPQMREISRLTWPTMTIPQVAIPVKIKGKEYLVEVDEYSTSGEGGSVGGNGAVVGAARMIDISDETKPKVVGDMRLAVHQPENREAIAGDYGAQSPVQGYAGHYCNVPRRVDPGIVACSMIASGLRVFDIRNPAKPKEIAYFMSPPSTISATGGPIIDERSNWAMSQPAFAPERGEIWYSDGNSGFYTLKMDPAVWPFPEDAGCVADRGIRSARVVAKGAGAGVQLERSRSLPVRTDFFRASRGRRVVSERVRRPGETLPPGTYVARLRMLDGGAIVDQRNLVFVVTGKGIRAVATHQSRDTCGLLERFRLARPVFGGTAGTPLKASFRLGSKADVTLSIVRGGKTIRRVVKRGVSGGRVNVRPKGLARGLYTVRLQAAGVDEQVAATVAVRRL